MVQDDEASGLAQDALSDLGQTRRRRDADIGRRRHGQAFTPAAPRPPTTSTFSPATPRSTARSRRRAPSACGSTPRAGRCLRGENKVGCRRIVCVEKEDAILKDSAADHRYHDQFAACDRPDRAGALLAFLGDAEPDAGGGRAGAPARPACICTRILPRNCSGGNIVTTSTACGRSGLPESVGWLGSDVWFAHSIFMTSEEIKRFARTGAGVAQCPSANMRCGQGARQDRDARYRRQGRPRGRRLGPPTTPLICSWARLAMMLQRVAPHHYLSGETRAAAADSAALPRHSRRARRMGDGDTG